MKSINPDAFKYEKFSVVGFSMPKAAIPLIDNKAAEAFLARSAWLRQTIMNALYADMKLNNEK
ncbi:hypothetical protein [Bradyrhizobium sp. G127]|uniref:hypothetical protein n=1 Tax=Bradyrhizobium sp. G127 TaxID=2904800 RepID=UPI001F1973E1|nr:hypothetical protein [Bradyrhizobium sp. G127]MCF2522395.1 hypothetical protein [Bradyrhizobium sp. G127]